MPEFSDDERILFRHQADFHRNKLGNLVGSGTITVTSQRILFESQDRETLFVTAWANIIKDQFSPSSDTRAMMRLELSTSAGSFSVFSLTGEGNLKNDLENLKLHVVNYRTYQRSVESMRSSTTAIDRRAALLEADTHLKRQYTDLVSEQKIMTEEEFWQLKMLDEETSAATNKRGRLLSILSDVDKGKKVDVGPELVASIFDMYPAVRRAYEDKVPTEYTEKEFWNRYFTSEYYAQVLMLL